MKFSALSLVLFVTACGGGKKDPVTLVDAPPGTDGNNNTAANSRNDMLLVTFAGNGFAATLTPQDDSPDNQAAPAQVASTGALKIAGEMGIGGDKSDEYFERDTYLIHTAADVNQLTVRLAWDGAASDHDFVLFEEGNGTDVPVAITSGTLISNDTNEFETFPVEGDHNYWLWTGVYQVNEDGSTAPTLPSPYDLSLYGEAFTPTNVGACDFTEAADATNDDLVKDPPGTAETSNITLATGAKVYCGVLNNGHFIPDPTDPTTNPGVVDVDSFSLTTSLLNPVKITLTGVTAQDQTALAAMAGVEYLVLDNQQQFFARGFFELSHGVLTTTLPPTIDDQGMETGPKTISLIGFDAADIGANINYKMEIAVDDPDTRAPRITTAADVTEAND